MEEVEKGVGGSEVKRGMGNTEELDENWQIRLTDKGERDRECCCSWALMSHL